GRFTWLTSQWKLCAYPAQFWVEINIYELEALLDAPAKFRPVVLHHALPARAMRTLTMRAHLLGMSRG
ncbi:hypothetical protein, partial [Paracoccus marcusii]|uniref:hypothetical protein n=1 Tax=Paracoccus marcusii TaxID=59779 RepID=UPI001AD84830